MTIVVVAVALVIASQVPRDLAAQRAAAGTQPLVGTWQLSGLEQAAGGQTLARVPNPVGILIHAGNGYVIEIITQAARPATLNAAEQFMTSHASWGRSWCSPSSRRMAGRFGGQHGSVFRSSKGCRSIRTRWSGSGNGRRLECTTRRA